MRTPSSTRRMTATGRLAGRLKLAPSSCTDYYLTVTPRTGAGLMGWPRGGMPLDAIHTAGPNFHAMAEIRLNPWRTVREPAWQQLVRRRGQGPGRSCKRRATTRRATPGP